MVEKCSYKCSFSKYSRLILSVIRRSHYVERRGWNRFYHVLTGKLYVFNVAEIGDCEVIWYE